MDIERISQRPSDPAVTGQAATRRAERAGGDYQQKVDPERVRPHFRRLRELRDRCAEILGAPLPVLSMGMSGDLEVAIEEGSTQVRIGTALFGERPRMARDTDAD